MLPLLPGVLGYRDEHLEEEYADKSHTYITVKLCVLPLFGWVIHWKIKVKKGSVSRQTIWSRDLI